MLLEAGGSTVNFLQTLPPHIKLKSEAAEKYYHHRISVHMSGRKTTHAVQNCIRKNNPHAIRADATL